eukprot:Clim_evm46s149 gene=Clim_evmTU46s149
MDVISNESSPERFQSPSQQLTRSRSHNMRTANSVSTESTPDCFRSPTQHLDRPRRLQLLRLRQSLQAEKKKHKQQAEDRAESTSVALQEGKGGQSIIDIESPEQSPGKSNQDGTPGQKEPCAICYEQIEVRGWIPNCKHEFCYACILEWSKLSNNCPMCKQEFTELIEHKVGEEGVLDIVHKMEPPPAPVETVEELAYCMICGNCDREDVLLLCDGCDQPYHTFCVGLNRVPYDDWYCHRCRTVSVRRGRRGVLVLSDNESDDGGVYYEEDVIMLDSDEDSDIEILSD